MAFSFSRLIISESDHATCERAFKMVNKDLFQATKRGTASCVGNIESFEVWLGFWKGIPSWKCSCTKTLYTQSTHPCAHAVALSIAWDRNRGVPNPSSEDIEFLTQKR